jgi:hypothetical protein
MCILSSTPPCRPSTCPALLVGVAGALPCIVHIELLQLKHCSSCATVSKTMASTVKWACVSAVSSLRPADCAEDKETEDARERVGKWHASGLSGTAKQGISRRRLAKAVLLQSTIVFPLSTSYNAKRKRIKHILSGSARYVHLPRPTSSFHAPHHMGPPNVNSLPHLLVLLGTMTAHLLFALQWHILCSSKSNTEPYASCMKWKMGCRLLALIRRPRI